MYEHSRITIERYCDSHNSKKSRQLGRLVKKSYDMEYIASDVDALFLEKVIQSEKDPDLKEAMEDLDDFLFCGF